VEPPVVPELKQEVLAMGVRVQENLPVEQRPIELTGPVLIGHHEKMGYDESVLWGWKVVRVHVTPPLVRSRDRLRQAEFRTEGPRRGQVLVEAPPRATQGAMVTA